MSEMDVNFKDDSDGLLEFANRIQRERDELRETLERERALLLDPSAVHQGMLRGTVAKLDWPTLEHIHGEHPLRGLAKELSASLACLCRKYDAFMDPENEDSGTYSGAYHAFYKGHYSDWSDARNALAKAREAGIL